MGPQDSEKAVDIDDLLNRGYLYALSLTHNQEEAWDLIQSAYLKVHHLQTALKLPYLFRVLKNLYIDQYRKSKVRLNWLTQQKQRKSGIALSCPEFPHMDPFLDKTLKQLDPLHREVLFLSSVEKYTAQEIGAFLDMPKNSVLSILHRTKKKLQKKLSSNLVGSP
jgi:RNA polymerase sigma-70 factor (ECF subfamily)